MDQAILRRQRRKEARAAQGEDYRLHVQPRLTHYIAVQRSVQAWARLAAVLLCLAHAGLLILMAAGARMIVPASAWFIIGLIAAALLVLAGFLYTFFQARALFGRLGQHMFVSEALSYDSDWPLRYVEEPRGRDFRSRPEFKMTSIVGLLAGIVSAACLVIGLARIATAV